MNRNELNLGLIGFDNHQLKKLENFDFEKFLQSNDKKDEFFKQKIIVGTDYYELLFNIFDFIVNKCN